MMKKSLINQLPYQKSSYTYRVWPFSRWSQSKKALASMSMETMISPCWHLMRSLRVMAMGSSGLAMSKISSLISQTLKPHFSMAYSFWMMERKNMLMMKESMAPLWQTSSTRQKYWIASGAFLLSIAKTNYRKPLQSISPFTVGYSSKIRSITIDERPFEYFDRSSFFRKPFLSVSNLLNRLWRAVEYWMENQFWLRSYSEYLSCLSSYSSARMVEVSMSLMQILPVLFGSRKKKNLRVAAMIYFSLKPSSMFLRWMKVGISSEMYSQRLFSVRQPLPAVSQRLMWIRVWKRLFFLTIEWKKDCISIRPYSSLSNLRKVEALKKCLNFRGSLEATVKNELQFNLSFPS